MCDFDEKTQQTQPQTLRLSNFGFTVFYTSYENTF